MHKQLDVVVRETVKYGVEVEVVEAPCGQVGQSYTIPWTAIAGLCGLYPMPGESGGLLVYEDWAEQNGLL